MNVNNNTFNSANPVVKQVSPIQKLPDELLLQIFGHLDINDLETLSRVNVLCNRVAADNKLWESIARRIGYDNTVDGHKLSIDNCKQLVTNDYKSTLSDAKGFEFLFPKDLLQRPITMAKLQNLTKHLRPLNAKTLVNCIKLFVETAPEEIFNIMRASELGNISADDLKKLAGYVLSQNIRDVWTQIAIAAGVSDGLTTELMKSSDPAVVHASFQQFINENQQALKKTTELHLENLQLIYLPQEIQHLINLEILVLENNSLPFLPDWVGSLTKIKMLDLSQNYLDTLPTSINQLQSLEELNLWHNKLTHMPESLRSITSLKWLHLSSNKIAEVPDWISTLNKMDELELSDNPIKHLPESVGQMHGLYSLDLSNTKLDSIPPFIFDIENLGELDINARLCPSLSPLASMPARSKELRIRIYGRPDNLIDLGDKNIVFDIHEG